MCLARAVGRDLRPASPSWSREHRTTLVFVNTRRLAERVAARSGRARSARTRSPPTTAACRRSGGSTPSSGCKAGRAARRWSPPPRSSWASTSAPSTWCARSARRAASPRSCSASAARATRVGATPKGRLLPDHARRAGRVRRAAARRARGPRSTALRPAARAARHPGPADRGRACAARPGARTTLFDAGAPRLRPTRRSRARTSTRSSSCSPRASRPAAAGARRCLHRDGVNGVLRGAARRAPRRRSPPAAPSPRPPTTACSPSPTTRFVGTRQRGLRHREHGRRHLPARQHVVADPARRGRAWCAWSTPQGAPPTIPFWLGEAPGAHARAVRARSSGLRARGRRSAWRRDGRDAPRLARDGAAASPRAAARAAGALPRRPRSRALGVVPTHEDVVFERFFDETGGMQLVLHAPFGGAHQPRLGPGAAQALLPAASTSSCRPRPPTTRSCSRSARSTASRSTTCSHFLQPAQRARGAGAGPAARRRCSRRAGAGTRRARWRCCASAAASASRRRSSACAPTTCWRRSSPSRPAARRTPPGPIEIPDHPLVRQTMHDCLHEAMDVDGLERVLAAHRGAARSACTRATRRSRRPVATRS